MAAGGTSRLRCLCLVRCVVATVVTVLTAAVLIRAAFLMIHRIHPQKLQLRIPRSSVVVARPGPKSFSFSLYLSAKNHRGGAFVYYNDIAIRLTDPSLPSNNNTVAGFNLTMAISLSQLQREEDYYLSLPYRGKNLDRRYIDKLFPDPEEASSSSPTPSSGMEVDMEVDGLLTDYAEATIDGNIYRAKYNCVRLKLSATDLPSPSEDNTRDCVPNV